MKKLIEIEVLKDTYHAYASNDFAKRWVEASSIRGLRVRMAHNCGRDVGVVECLVDCGSEVQYYPLAAIHGVMMASPSKDDIRAAAEEEMERQAIEINEKVDG